MRTTKTPPKTPAARQKDAKLADDYASEARGDTLRAGDELSELAPVGRKPAGKSKRKN